MRTLEGGRISSDEPKQWGPSQKRGVSRAAVLLSVEEPEVNSPSHMQKTDRIEVTRA